MAKPWRRHRAAEPDARQAAQVTFLRLPRSLPECSLEGDKECCTFVQHPPRDSAMSEHATAEPTRARFIHVEAQADHLESLARGKPVTALAELVWNALDADADRVRIGITDNDLGNPAVIEVADNGSGISLSEAERAFGNLDGSWKREQRVTQRGAHKKMHGRDGKGRFKAFARGHRVEWDTVFLAEDDQAQHYVIKGSSDRLPDFEIGAPSPAPNGRGRGTRVRITGIQESLGVRSRDGSASRQLAEVFALYLRNYPATDIIYRGERIDPKAVQKAHETHVLPCKAIGSWRPSATSPASDSSL